MKMTPEKIFFDSQPWKGKTKRYDIIQEGTIALAVVVILVMGFALIFGSPDEKSLTFKGWASSNAENFYATAVQELAGSSGTATYGAPYNKGSDGLNLGPLWLQKWNGATAQARMKWATSYDSAIAKAEGKIGAVGAGDYGPGLELCPCAYRFIAKFGEITTGAREFEEGTHNNFTGIYNKLLSKTGKGYA